MIVPDTLELITTPGDDLPSEQAMNPVEDHGNIVVIPISRIGHLGIWMMTIALAIIATPFIYLVSSSLDFTSSANRIPWFMKFVPWTAWFLCVFGPICVYYFFPFGSMNPDHWLLFDRSTDTLSYRGGFHRWNRDQIQYLLAISGSPSKSKQLVTEFQICIGDSHQCKKHLISNTTQRDPEFAYGKTLRAFASAMQVPAYLAKLRKDGSCELIQIVGKPMASPESN